MHTEHLLALTARLLRDPRSIVEQSEDADAYARLVPQLLLLTGFGAAIFGATVGSYRGGIQIAYAALKAPFLLGIPMLVILPAVRALWSDDDAEAPSARVALTGLVATARMGLMAAATSPVLWLLYSVQIDYHLAILLLATSLVVAALPGLWVFHSAFPSAGRSRVLALLGTVGLFGLVSAQTGWILRPFVARPTAQIALLRAVEADVFDALDTSAASATGRYGEWEVEPSGALGELQQRGR